MDPPDHTGVTSLPLEDPAPRPALQIGWRGLALIVGFWTVFAGVMAGSLLLSGLPRSGEASLAYATDEDTRGTDPDPDTNRFDLGSDPVEYANVRLQTMKDLLPGLVDRSTKEGDDYTQARRVFNVLVSQYGQSMFFVSRYVGGLQTSRSHKGDKDGKPPVDKSGKPLRVSRKYSGEVGQVLATVQGVSAKYTLTGKELYVRAVVTSNLPPADPSFEGQKQQAWTQPVGWEWVLDKAAAAPR